jgi:signal transduction histidine kinase
VGSDGRRDSYGITGMRERADALGGVLDISSGPAGTTVRCELEIG